MAKQGHPGFSGFFPCRAVPIRPPLYYIARMDENTAPLLGVCQTPVLRSEQALLPFLDEAAAQARAHAPDRTALFLLPELFWGGFDYAQRQPLAEETPELLRWLHAMAADRGLLLVGSFWEHHGGRYFNTLYRVGQGLPAPERLRSKAMLFPLSQEELHFSPGEEDPEPFQCIGLTCGAAVCYELRFPEVFRYQGRRSDGGLDLALLCSQWPAARGEHLEVLSRARALENQCWLLSCNACGPSPLGALAGGSRLYSPWGEALFVCDATPGVRSASYSHRTLQRARAAFDTRACARFALQPVASPSGPVPQPAAQTVS